MGAIKYLTNAEIDKTKWDMCILKSSNGNVYVFSFYLDTVCKNWDALVLNDYDMVLPLTWNKKYGITYLYQPPFAANLGVFGSNINATSIDAFLKAIPKKFTYWDIYFNNGNCFKLKDFNLYQRVNYTLSLNSSYQNIYNQYSKNTQRNIKKSTQQNCTIKKDFLVEQVIDLAIEQSKSFSNLTVADFERAKKLYYVLHKKKQSITYGVFLNDKLLASAAFFFSHGRAYYVLVGNHTDGKNVGASHALIDAFIKDYASQNWVLDFEGSDIKNIALFYSSFGATIEKYTAIKLNRMPKLIKWLKP